MHGRMPEFPETWEFQGPDLPCAAGIGTPPVSMGYLSSEEARLAVPVHLDLGDEAQPRFATIVRLAKNRFYFQLNRATSREYTLSDGTQRLRYLRKRGKAEALAFN